MDEAEERAGWLTQLGWRWVVIDRSRIQHLIPGERALSPGRSTTACHRITITGSTALTLPGSMLVEPGRCLRCERFNA